MFCAAALLVVSSGEIADLLNIRHASVKRSVERQVERGTIDVPPVVGHQIQTAHGRKHDVSVFELCKRDSLVVVAQLSPEFTATDPPDQGQAPGKAQSMIEEPAPLNPS